ncbi:MAG: PorP/SprF family type IX secretion system membrane protein [Eudoraea sp.]|nr:PorP/SprF family type IX secretion system membrane protein [Eudoraea sp.]
MFCNKLSIFHDSNVATHFRKWVFLAVSLSFMGHLYSQEETPYVSYDVPFQNLLKFNRFLINPTFSTVREDKSYINFFHRSQSAYFQDNNQNYFLSYSGRINDRTGLGVSVYNQQEGLFSNIGILTNYAYGVKLSDKSNLTFGVNIPYYRSSFDDGRAVTNEEDPLLGSLSESSIIAIQPGLNISYGPFDFGVFAENLFDFNLKTGNALTEMNEKTFSGHLQYTKSFKYANGILKDGKIMPLARLRMIGGESLVIGGGVILDLPKLGWLQAGYDSFYGGSAGAGFNINQRLSLGYNLEKGLSQDIGNFGVTHEISIAYNFVPKLTEDMVQQLYKGETDYLDDKRRIRKKKNPLYLEIDKLRKLNRDNYAVINELIYKVDSLEKHMQSDMEKRFAMAIRSARREINDAKSSLYQEEQRDVLAKATPTAKSSVYRLTEQTKMDIQKNIDSLNRLSQLSYGPNKQLQTKKFSNLVGVPEGHYVIANVFETTEYLNKFLKHLEDNNIEADYFVNPVNGLKYVYLAHYEGSNEDLQKVKSGFKEKYSDHLWIMHVDNTRNTRMATLKFEE